MNFFRKMTSEFYHVFMIEISRPEHDNFANQEKLTTRIGFIFTMKLILKPQRRRSNKYRSSPHLLMS